MNKIVVFKKFLSVFLILALFANTLIFPKTNAVSTNGAATPWTMEKAEHLAKRALIGVHSGTVMSLYNAGSASNAVNILFPSVSGPDRSAYNLMEENFKGVAFNPSDTNAMRKLYAFRYYADPYEAKRKLFGLFEDIFPVDRTGVGVNDINFPDIENHFDVLYSETLGNYKTMVRKVFFDVSKPENSFAMGRYLDLLNQPDKNYPNENYARELMQLFLMLEYKPWEDAETPGAQRNYTEPDVAALAKLITGFRSGEDKKVYFDMNHHHTGSSISFLTGALKSGDSFPFYNSASGTIDSNLLVVPRAGNNGVADNILDYIFSKREAEIAYFLSWRLLKYYVKDKPTQSEIEFLANQIISNNFNIYPTVKWLLSSDMMYSEEAMNAQRFKNPLELTIGLLKQLHGGDTSVIDPILSDSNLLNNLDWTPYNPRSIFGRAGFDDNVNFMNAYFHNQWATYASRIAFASGTGVYNLSDLIPVTRKNTGTIEVKTHSGNTFSGSISLSNISVTLRENIFPFVLRQEFGETQAEIFAPEDFQEIENNSASGSEVVNDDKIEETTASKLPGDDQMIPSENENTSQTSDAGIKTDISQDTKETQTEKMIEEKIINALLPDKKDAVSPGLSPMMSQEMPSSVIEDSKEVPASSQPEGPSQESDNAIPSLSSFFFPKAHADIVSENTITFATGVVILPEFYILTSSGNRIYLEGNYNLDTNSLTISSGSLTYGTGNYALSGSSFTIDSGANLQRDITIDEMMTQLEDYLYLGKRLPESVKNEIKTYLLTTDTGASRPFLPNNVNYRNKYIKAVLAMMLVQPEFMMLSGFDTPTTQINTGNTPINNANSKLVLIELYGGYDWMNGIIPKTDFNYYQDIRKEMAITGSQLIDLGSVYMNKSLEAFKPYYDSGELRIVNRVGAPNHSRGHDTAAIQIASQKALQTVDTPGLIGELIKNESNPLNHIVLGTGKPPIYTNGKYINIGGNSILYKNNISGTTAERNHQVNTLRNLLQTRNYPGTSSNVFKNSLTLDEVGRTGQETTGHTLSGRLNFAKNLMDNDLGITYYVGGGGGYDTHGEQLKTGTGVYNLNDRTRDLSRDIVAFFDKAKASGNDLTIVVYSEFGRTLETNGSKGTDHGEGGGYFILTTNNGLKLSLPDKVIGKISPEKEYHDWFGVGIDYRSIFTKILTVLYNIDATSYFLGEYNLDDDLNSVIPNPVLLRTEYDNTYSNNIIVDLKFKVDDKNFRFRDGSYIKFYHGTNSGSLNQYSRWQIDNYTYNSRDNSFKIGLNLTRGIKYYYRLEIVDNQYDSYIASGSFDVPTKITNASIVQIPLTTDSYFSKYDNTQVSNIDTPITKLVWYDNPLQAIYSSGITSSGITSSGATSTGMSYTGSVQKLSFTGGIDITFGTGETSISTLYGSGVWNGGFVLPKLLNKTEFLSEQARYNNFLYLKKDATLDTMIQVGPDTLGVGMKLNQSVDISLPLSRSFDDYTILGSIDGISWTDVPRAFATATGGKITFTTDRLGYFAVMGLYDVTPIDTTPDVFSFTPVTNAVLSSEYISNTITVTGIDSGTQISVIGGEYRINSGLYTTATGIVNVGQRVTLRATSSNNYATTTQVTLNIGGVIGNYTITTQANTSSGGSNSGGGNSGGSTGGGNSGGGSSGGGSSTPRSSGGGGGGGLSMDNCPNGDFSPSYYDKTCGIKPTTSSKPVIKDKAYYQALKEQILKDRMKAKQTLSSQNTSKPKTTSSLLQVTYKGFPIYYVNGYQVSLKTRTLALQIIQSKKLTPREKSLYITRINEYLVANHNYDFATIKTRELKNKVIKQEILLKGVINKL